MRKPGFSILLMIVVLQCYAIDGILVKTIDYSFQEKWNNTISSSIPAISTCNRVFMKQYFFLTVSVGDYASDKNDSSNVEYSISINKPDKSIYLAQEHLPVVKGKLANKDNLQMSDAVLKVCFESNDQLGRYEIEVKINDLISGKSKKIASDITLVDLPAYDKYEIKTDDDFGRWYQKYYEDPKPGTALANYIYYSKSKLPDKKTSFPPVFSFFLEIAKNNKYLASQIIDCYKSQDLKTKKYLLTLMTCSNIGTDEFFNSLEGDEMDTYKKRKNNPLEDVYGNISSPSKLDMLWGTFMASGSYQPILKLIQTLDYTKFQGELEKFKKSNQTGDRQKAINNTIYMSLVWSLKSNCKQHKLVKEYCDWALQYENLSGLQKNELKAILKEN